MDEMERLPVVSKCYDQWLMLQGKVDSYYHDKPQERIPALTAKGVPADQECGHSVRRSTCGWVRSPSRRRDLGQYDEPEEFRNASYDYWALRDVIRDESLTMEERERSRL